MKKIISIGILATCLGNENVFAMFPAAQFPRGQWVGKYVSWQESQGFLKANTLKSTSEERLRHAEISKQKVQERLTQTLIEVEKARAAKFLSRLKEQIKQVQKISQLKLDVLVSEDGKISRVGAAEIIGQQTNEISPFVERMNKIGHEEIQKAINEEGPELDKCTKLTIQKKEIWVNFIAAVNAAHAEAGKFMVQQLHPLSSPDGTEDIDIKYLHVASGYNKSFEKALSKATQEMKEARKTHSKAQTMIAPVQDALWEATEYCKWAAEKTKKDAENYRIAASVGQQDIEERAMALANTQKELSEVKEALKIALQKLEDAKLNDAAEAAPALTALPPVAAAPDSLEDNDGRSYLPVSFGVRSLGTVSDRSGGLSPLSHVSENSFKTTDTIATTSTMGSSGESADDNFEVVLPAVSLGGSKQGEFDNE